MMSLKRLLVPESKEVLIKQNKTRQGKAKKTKQQEKKNIVGGQQIQEPTEKTLNGKNWENLSTKETD